MRKMRNKIVRNIFMVMLLSLLALSLEGCGNKKKIVGKWYEVDTEPKDYIEFTYDNKGYVSSEKLSFTYELYDEDKLVITFSYGEAVKFHIVEMDGYKYLIEEGDDEPDWSSSKSGAIYLENQKNKALEIEEKIREEEESLKQEEKRILEEKEAEKLELEFILGENTLKNYNDSVLSKTEGKCTIVLQIDERGKCFLTLDYDMGEIGSTHNSYEGTLSRGENPGEFNLNVVSAGYYYLLQDKKHNERIETDIPDGKYNILIKLIKENGKFSKSRLLLSYKDYFGYNDESDVLLEK